MRIITKRKFRIAFASTLFAAALIRGVSASAQNQTSEEAPTPRMILKYLESKTGRRTRDYNVEDGKRVDYHQAGVAQLESKAENRRNQYWLIQNQLAVATRMLADESIETRKDALGICFYAATFSANDLSDETLCRAISEGLIYPNFEDLPADQTQHLGRVSFAKGLMAAFITRKAYSDAEKAGRLWLEHSTTDNSRDSARVRIAYTLREQNRYADAADVLEEIDPHGALSGALSEVDSLNKKAADRPASD